MADESSDRMVVKLDPGAPIELTDLTGSFAALARIYERHYRPTRTHDDAPKLYVTRLESGSVIAEIVPYVQILGAMVATMDGGITISDFTRRLWAGIKTFSNPDSLPEGAKPPIHTPSSEDASDIREFMKPLAGKKGAVLSIKHARIEHVDGDRHTVAEYTFDEVEINRASINIDQALSAGVIVPQIAIQEATDEDTDKEIGGHITKEVMLFIEQASRKPGKERGRTGDRGIIPDISAKSLPVYFRKSFQNLKDQMIKGAINPLTNYAFVVDVHVQRLKGKPKAYMITNIHDTIELDDDAVPRRD